MSSEGRTCKSCSLEAAISLITGLVEYGEFLQIGLARGDKVIGGVGRKYGRVADPHLASVRMGK